jgi:hypothetical protein
MQENIQNPCKMVGELEHLMEGIYTSNVNQEESETNEHLFITLII